MQGLITGLLILVLLRIGGGALIGLVIRSLERLPL